MGFGSGTGSNPPISAASDVALNNPANNNAFTYDSTIQKWKNTTPSTGLVTLSGHVTGPSNNTTLANNAVSTTAIADGAVTEAKLHGDIIDRINTTANIEDGIVTNAKVAPNAEIDQSKISGLVSALAAKSATGHTHTAAGITSGVLNPARLGTGTPSSTTYLRGDGTWQTSTGATGDQGIQGPQGAQGNGIARVEHGSVASTARPAGVYMVLWLGSVQPTYMQNGDLWIETTSIIGEPTLPVSGLVAHYRASDLSLSDGAPVSTWANRVSGGVNLAATSAPVYRNANGRKYVALDGIDDYLTAAVATVNQPTVTLIVARLVTPAASAPLISSTSVTARNVIAQSTSGSKFNAYAGTNLQSGVSTDTNWHFIAATYNGTSSAIRVDTTLNTGTSGTEARTGLRIGASRDITSFAAMEIAEVAVYNRSLTGTEMDNIYAAMKGWYSL